jgi:hypothetical protein
MRRSELDRSGAPGPALRYFNQQMLIHELIRGSLGESLMHHPNDRTAELHLPPCVFQCLYRRKQTPRLHDPESQKYPVADTDGITLVHVIYDAANHCFLVGQCWSLVVSEIGWKTRQPTIRAMDFQWPKSATRHYREIRSVYQRDQLPVESTYTVSKRFVNP